MQTMPMQRPQSAIVQPSPRLSPRLVQAAHEFEAQMMTELLKPLTAEDLFSGDEGDLADGSGGTLGAFASEALGRALSGSGGFGIANRILDSLSPATKGVSGRANQEKNTEGRQITKVMREVADTSGKE